MPNSSLHGKTPSPVINLIKGLYSPHLQCMLNEGYEHGQLVFNSLAHVLLEREVTNYLTMELTSEFQDFRNWVCTKISKYSFSNVRFHCDLSDLSLFLEISPFPYFSEIRCLGELHFPKILCNYSILGPRRREKVTDWVRGLWNKFLSQPLLCEKFRRWTEGLFLWFSFFKKSEQIFFPMVIMFALYYRQALWTAGVHIQILGTVNINGIFRTHPHRPEFSEFHQSQWDIFKILRQT